MLLISMMTAAQYNDFDEYKRKPSNRFLWRWLSRHSPNMTADKVIFRVTNQAEQQAETYRYWHGLSVGDRLSAVWDLSEAAYAFAAAFNKNPTNDANSLKELLRAFNDPGVKYLVVGGYAYGVHAEPRATKDLDIFIRSDQENSQAVFRALAQFGAPLHGLSIGDFMDGSTFQIGLPPARIDLMQRIDGISFDEAWKNRIQGLIEGEISVMVISRNDLIRNKLASGRDQDILDAKRLQETEDTE